MCETMKKYAFKAKNLTDFCEKYHIPGKQYDLCDRCAKFIDGTIKVGVKPEWLGK